MATLITDVIDIPDLIGYARESAVLTGPNLSGIVSPREVDDLEYELLNLESPYLEIARYRAWDTAPPIGKRPGLAQIKGEIMPLGWSRILNEKELKRLTKLREGITAKGGRPEDIYDDAAATAMACAFRFEQARADLLLDGKVTINENGVKVEANFGIPGGHVVTAGTLWSDYTNGVPITNLKAWETTLKAANGGRKPDFWLTSDEVVADLTLSAQVRNLAPVTGVVPSIMSNATVASIIQAQGISPIVPFEGFLPDSAGTGTTRTLPARKVIAVYRGVAELFFGTTPSADMLVAQGLIQRRDAAGIIAIAQEQIIPAQVKTTSEAVGLPVLRDPKALFVATV